MALSLQHDSHVWIVRITQWCVLENMQRNNVNTFFDITWYITHIIYGCKNNILL